MRIEDIELHVGTSDFEFKPIRRLEAKCEATTAFSPAPTVDEVNGKLRAMAAKVGANAVIEVKYNSGVSLTSWKSMKGTGLAVTKFSDEKVCPVCAETIKSAAKKCRFCGAEIENSTQADGLVKPAPRQNAPSDTEGLALESEPLRETNNPQMWLIVGAAIFLLLIVLGTA